MNLTPKDKKFIGALYDQLSFTKFEKAGCILLLQDGWDFRAAGLRKPVGWFLEGSKLEGLNLREALRENHQIKQGKKKEGKHGTD